MSHVDAFMVQKTKKSKNGRTKADYEMKCFWKTPKGGKFTYRSDDIQSRLKETNNIDINSELRAIQFQFGVIRKRVLAAIIYDNTLPFGEDNVLFHYNKGKVEVDKLNWDLAKPKKKREEMNDNLMKNVTQLQSKMLKK